MSGIQAYAAYVPRYRLPRAAIAFGEGNAKGARPVARFDEDTTTMGVEAARRVLRASARQPRSLWFATTRPAYLEKNNASTIAAAVAVELPPAAFDCGGSLRSGVGALLAAAGDSGLAVLSDIRYGLPGSDDERGGADGAVAFSFGPDPIAEIVGHAHATFEILDRWRPEGSARVHSWEDRFSADAYGARASETVDGLLKQHGLVAGDVAHVALSSANSRVATALREYGVDSRAGDELGSLGYFGAADLGMALASALDAAGPDEYVLAVSAADGVDAILLRMTELAGTHRPGVSVSSSTEVDYTTFLAWRQLVTTEPARRPPPQRAYGPPALRAASWKFAFVGSRCGNCGTSHLPPQEVCMSCRSRTMIPRSMADVSATVATFTVDHLTASLSRPTVDAVLDFAGGGRYPCELVEVEGGDVEIGMDVEMAFRIFDRAADGSRNYFWKAKPAVRTER